MNRYLQYFILIFLFISSCSSDKKLQEENETLKAELNILKDSVETLNTETSYFKDDISLDSSRGFLGNLYSDTLVLFAQFSECGEFGGHKEWFKIFKESDTVKCIMLYDSVNCNTAENDPSRFFRLTSATYVLSRTQEKEIVQYLGELTKLSFCSQQRYANANDYYSAEIFPSDSNSPYNNEFSVNSSDLSFQWSEFRELKAILKN